MFRFGLSDQWGRKYVRRKKAKKGDVICVCRQGISYYGIYTGANQVIHCVPKSEDNTESRLVRESDMKEFMGETTEYGILTFAKKKTFIRFGMLTDWNQFAPDVSLLEDYVTEIEIFDERLQGCANKMQSDILYYLNIKQNPYLNNRMWLDIFKSIDDFTYEAMKILLPNLDKIIENNKFDFLNNDIFCL